MKKISIILAMVAMVLGVSSCKQEDEPKYHAPTTFTVNEPALQNQVFRCAADMTDAETFNLFCSQPDYGYSAICEYSALVSLNPDAPESEWIALPNETPTSASMAIKTYELGVAVNQLLNVVDYADFVDREIYDKEYKVYLKAVCQIPSIEGSRIVSSNYVCYNKVMINYAEKKPAWIYICGDVENIDTGMANGFTAPSVANLDAYMNNWSLFEPDDMIGEKLYVGSFNVTPKADAANPDTSDPGNVDQCAQFRFFTELLGWTPDASLGSNEADFFCLPITDKWTAGYSGDIVAQGLGNWGVFITEKTPITIVVDVPNLKVFCKEGVHEVSFVGRDPEFN
ncbi:MAG: hypothetical protein K2K64_01760 [Muribaculaceae bacterium]|nr:hypothetical protein [Muribaculaceae bacterium]MDE7108994.1 hypothetical protein [Muribaculaceae bacterium]